MPPKKGRLPLSGREILDLDAALIEAFRTIRALRARFSAAKHIKYPPLPSVFSESIVIAAAGKLFGDEWKARYGGAECDVILENTAMQQRRVEVKATGEHAFQEFKAKDLRADVLVWVRFGRRFQDGTGRIEIALLENPGLVITGPCRLDTARFERRLGSAAGVKLFSFESLDELLEGTGTTAPAP
jgi:hypothetical protein